MSLENDFLVFAGASGANVLTQSAYAAASTTPTGYVSGVASSAAVNKTLRQCSIMAAMIAQFIVDKAVQPVVDDGTIATIETNFEAAILAIADTVNIPMSQVTGLTAALAGYLPLHATADAAAKIATARNIALTGAVTGAVNFDGSANVSMATTFETIAANSLLANPTGSTASPVAITIANGLVFSGTVLGLGSITVTGITDTGNLSVTGNANVTGTLGVTGATTMGSLSVTTTSVGGIGITSSSTNAASLNLVNTSTGGHNWSIGSSGSAGSVAAGSFLLYDNTSNAARFSIDGSGNGNFPGLFTCGQFTCNGTAQIAVTTTEVDLFLQCNNSSAYRTYLSNSSASGLFAINMTGSSGSYAGSPISFNRQTGATTFAYAVTFSSTQNTTSDETLKRDIRELPPRSFHREVPFKTWVRIDTGEVGYGPTAQDLRRFDPRYVGTFDYYPDGPESPAVKKLNVDKLGVAYEQSMNNGHRLDDHETILAQLAERLALLEA